jgi:phosphatidylinositol kinase/protein kinase (PI-3  family)
MHNQETQKKFGLYLEVFVNKITLPLYKIFKDEDLMLKALVSYAEKVKNNPDKEERDRIFKQDLTSLNELYKEKNKEVSLPLNFKYRIKGLIVDKCRIMKSKKKPLWLTFENADPQGDPIVCMLKCGDDLRMDMVTLQLFQSMQTLWFENGLQVKMALYKVLCTGNMQGMLEMVTNSNTLADIHVQEGGAIKQLFSIAAVSNWIEKNCKSVSPTEAKENFLMSNVAYCLATFVLGIGDRHNDNIMMKKNGELFHIDFGHFLGHFKYKMGIKRERAPFVFTRQFQYVLGGDDSEMFKKFKEKLHLGYYILRKNKDVLVTLLRMLLCTGIPELNEKSLKFLETSLALKKTDKEASDFLEKKLYESMDSVSTKLNFAIHIVANK